MPSRRSLSRSRFPSLLVLLCALPLGLLGAGPTNSLSLFATDWQPFGFLTSSAYGYGEKLGLLACVILAVTGLGYAAWLMREVYAASTGTPAMQAVAKAVREGANAYLRRQFTVVGVLIVLLTGVIVASKWPWELEPGQHSAGELKVIAFGRGLAFFMGALFSASVGFTGMRLATAGNLRVAAAAQVSFGDAMRLAYRTGTITGMFTCGLGLLGGSVILLVFGELAYEILIGYGFGGSLLALFMRVGGGIYTKAADVGADLVGKVEQSMAEDDPRNAATIADNVGDNVGDCAGMAADVFESYSVTMVAAVMLGYAAFGYKGMIFPLLVQGVGVVGSIISTSMVGRGITNGNSGTAMNSINRGFWRSAAISTVGFLTLGAIYLQFDAAYIVERAIDKGLYQELYDNAKLRDEVGLHLDSNVDVSHEVKKLRELRNSKERNGENTLKLEEKVDHWRDQALTAWRKLDKPKQLELSEKVEIDIKDLTTTERDRLKSYGHQLPDEKKYSLTLLELAHAVPRSPFTGN